jgi:predicted AAA+ superfamily ATPase
VLLRGEEIYTNPEEMGTIVETTVLRHLFAYYYQDTPEIVYWRDASTQREVDIIVRSPAYVLPFEVKYKTNPQLNKKSGLGVYCASESPKQAYLVTQREADFVVTRLKDVDTSFLKIPAYILCYLLGQSERLLWR